MPDIGGASDDRSTAVARGDAVQGGVIHGDVHIHGPSISDRDGVTNTSRVAVGRSLPRDIPNFVGRAKELSVLKEALRSWSAERPPVVVVTGMAGVGKTALAVRLAHQVADDYPDGQLFVSLGSRLYANRPADDVLTELLYSLGVPPNEIPQESAERASLYRYMLDGRQVLIVLDGVDDSRQIEQLIPRSPTCAIVVTSRHRLIQLESAADLYLDTMSHAEAVEILARIIGGAASSDYDNLERLADALGRLPLALSVAGAQLARRPGLALTDFVAQLQRGVAEASAPDSKPIIRAFDQAFADLDVNQARAFLLLSQFPGPQFDVDAAASMLDSTLEATELILTRLAAMSLLSQHDGEHRRYRYHDLIRTYARSHAEAKPAERKSALVRLLLWYIARVRDAVQVLTSMSTPSEPKAEAVAWLEGERETFLALTEQAATAGSAARVQDLSDLLFPVLPAARTLVGLPSSSRECAQGRPPRLEPGGRSAHSQQSQRRLPRATPIC